MTTGKSTTPQVQNPETTTGLVGWFDILGYKDFMKNSSLGYAIGVLKGIQVGVQPDRLARINGIIACLPSDKENERIIAEQARDSASWLVFSDTVVLAMPFPQSEPFNVRFVKVGMYLELAKDLMSHYMGTGLPARGAISFGEFYLHENPTLFAGRPLIEAQSWAENQEWSGCVFTPSGESIVNQTAARLPPDLRAVLMSETVRYTVACSNNRESRSPRSMMCLNWPNSIAGLMKDMDIPTFVKRQFSRHNKNTSSTGVQAKIDNTIKFMSHCESINGPYRKPSD